MITLLLHQLLSWFKRNLLTLILIGVVLFLLHSVAAWRADAKRESSNVAVMAAVLNHRIDTIMLTGGRTAQQTGVLQLTVGELKTSMPEIANDIRKLKVSPSAVQSYASAATATNTTFYSYLHDTTIADTVKASTYSYDDGYTSLKAVLQGNRVWEQVHNQDTLEQVVFRGPRPHWWWPFSKRPLLQRCALRNPNAHIQYSQHIDLK